MPVESDNMEATSELEQSFLDELKWVEIRSLWIEK